MNVIHNEVVDAILERRSVRAYTPEKLTEDEVNTIVQCGLWAPSARNHQTTMLAVVQDEKMLRELQEQILEKEEKPSEWLRTFYYSAPCVIFAYDRSGDRWSGTNAAIAAENMHVAAHSLGLGSVLIGIIREFMQSERGDAWKKRFGIPEDYDFAIALAVGHPAGTSAVPPRKGDNAVYVRGDTE